MAEAAMTDDFQVRLDPGTMKRAHRDQRKADKRTKRSQTRKQVRCWLTWPLRHEYAVVGDEYPRCVGCGKPRP